MYSPRDEATFAGRAFYASAFTTSLVIGGLQMYRVHAGVLTDYGADVFGTLWLYAMVRLGRTVVQRGRTVQPVPTAAVVFGLCTLSELGQLVGIVPGHYDPFDIVAFLAAVAASVVIERWMGPFAAWPPAVASASNPGR